MPATILLGPRRQITLDSALKKDENIIREAACYAADVAFRRALWDNRTGVWADMAFFGSDGPIGYEAMQDGGRPQPQPSRGRAG
jgi:hypothetical protein